MHSLRFIRYFLYLAINWDIPVAWHIITQERKGEKKYGINTTGADELKKLRDKGIDTSHATIYMPASYDLLEDIFQQLNMGSFQHFVDIGCGKGRALSVGAFYGVKKVTGVDFSKDLCNAAVKNLENIKTALPGLQYSIQNNDAFYYEIEDDTDCIFFFNPFDETIMSGVVQNILTSLQNNPRKITLIYLNPLNKELFTQAGFKEIYHTKKLRYLEGSILTNEVQ